MKSLAPDGKPCNKSTQGLLQRTKIAAGRLIPIGKETDRRWEQGEDPSMLEFEVQEYEGHRKMAIADKIDRNKWVKIGIRRLKRESGLSQKLIYAVLRGKPVRRTRLEVFKRIANNLCVIAVAKG